MKKNEMVKKVFGNNLMDAISEQLDHIVKEKYDVESLYTYLRGTNESIRVGLYVMALERNLKDVAKNIDKVNNMLNIRRKKDFMAAVKKNEADKYLASLCKSDKMALMKDLGIDVELQQRMHFTPEQREYYKILFNSIMEDQYSMDKDGIDQFITYKKENN